MKYNYFSLLLHLQQQKEQKVCRQMKRKRSQCELKKVISCDSHLQRAEWRTLALCTPMWILQILKQTLNRFYDDTITVLLCSQTVHSHCDPKDTLHSLAGWFIPDHTSSLSWDKFSHADRRGKLLNKTRTLTRVFGVSKAQQKTTANNKNHREKRLLGYRVILSKLVKSKLSAYTKDLRKFLQLPK